MKLRDFIESKKILILIQIILSLLITYFLLLKFQNFLIIIEVLFWFNLMFIISFLMYYFQMKKVIHNLIITEESLENKFLIKDVQADLNYEENLIFDVLDKISKSQYKEIKKLKTQLEEEKKAKVLWVHEIKQPLAILNDDNINEYNRKKAVNRINKNLNHILKYEKINEIGIDSNLVKVNLYEVICLVLKQYMYELVDIDAQVEIDVDEKQEILTDKFWLQFILEQLISNSIKYRREEQLKIIFSLKLEKDQITIRIKDNGIGVETNDLKNVFDQGYRGSNAKEMIQASGYGLYYIKEVSKKLNFNVKIKNNFRDNGISVDIIFKI